MPFVFVTVMAEAETKTGTAWARTAVYAVQQRSRQQKGRAATKPGQRLELHGRGRHGRGRLFMPCRSEASRLFGIMIIFMRFS